MANPTIKVAKKKERDNAALDAELKERRDAEATSSTTDDAVEDEPGDILATQEDEDVIF